jgi:hypothetical protein
MSEEDIGAHLRAVIARYGTEQPAATLYEHFEAQSGLRWRGLARLKLAFIAR